MPYDRHASNSSQANSAPTDREKKPAIEEDSRGSDEETSDKMLADLVPDIIRDPAKRQAIDTMLKAQHGFEEVVAKLGVSSVDLALYHAVTFKETNALLAEVLNEPRKKNIVDEMLDRSGNKSSDVESIAKAVDLRPLTIECYKRMRPFLSESLSEVGKDEGSLPVADKEPTADRPWYVYDLDDETSWLEQLRSHGFVVIRGVANADQVQDARDFIWDAICERVPTVNRNNPQTWGFPLNQPGICPWLAQSAGTWAVRGWPGVKQAFARIWETDDLIVSMDCALIWRPWWVNEDWKPQTEGLHLDQNPFTKPGFECVQGMVPLLPVNDVSGGLQVVPDSHLDAEKEAFKQTHRHMRNSGDWCPCDDDDLNEKALFLYAEPGDLVLWDSRTVHGGLVGTGEVGESAPAELARMSVTVNMTPRARATEHVLQLRRQGFQKGESFNHVPHEAGTSTGTVRAAIRRGFRPPVLTEAQRALL